MERNKKELAHNRAAIRVDAQEDEGVKCPAQDQSIGAREQLFAFDDMQEMKPKQHRSAETTHKIVLLR